MSKSYEGYKRHVFEKHPFLNGLNEKEKNLAESNFALDGIVAFHKWQNALPPTEYYPWLGYFIVSDAASTGMDEFMQMQFAVILSSVKPAFAFRIMEWENREIEAYKKYSLDRGIVETINSVVQLLKAHIFKPHSPNVRYWQLHASYMLQHCPPDFRTSCMRELIHPFRNSTGIHCPLEPQPTWQAVVTAYEYAKG